MPDGEMRRPPQPWESKIARATSVMGAGVASGNATSIVPDPPPPGVGGGVEPAPVLPAPGAFIAPSKPTLFRQVQGLGVLWDGLNQDGELWPYDTSWVEIHADTSGSAFTPSDATLKGRLARPGTYSVGGLTQGSTYYVRLRGADPAGNYTSAGVAESAITGGTISAVYISGGTMAAGYLSGGTISGGYITGGTVNGAVLTSASIGGYATSADIANFITAGEVNPNVTSISGGVITSGTIVGREIRSSSGNQRLVLTTGDTIDFYFDGTKRFSISSAQQSGGDYVAQFSGGIDIFAGGIYVNGAAVDMQGVYDNNTTGIDSVGINTAKRLRRISSTQAIKYDITALTNAMSASVDSARLSTVATVDPAGILDVAVAEFSVIDDGEATDRRVLGFIADDVADKLPIAVTRDEAGVPAGVLDTSLIAALLAVVQQQQADISALTARVEALEG